MDVNITMRPEAVALDGLDNGSGVTKHEVLARLAALFDEIYGLDASEILEGLEQREALGSTGFGKGIAIPHCRSSAVKRPDRCAAQTVDPLRF